MAIQRLKVPCALVGGRFATVDQGSSEEIAQCVRGLLATRQGSRDELPDLGLVDPVFNGVDPQEIETQIRTFEPRAAALIERHDRALDGVLEEYGVTVRRA